MNMENKTEVIVTQDYLPVPMDQKKEFKGYSMEELRYQRAILLMKKEFCKSKIIHDIDRVRRNGIFGRFKGETKTHRIGSLTTKLLSGLNYLDYAMVGASLFGTGKKIYNLFKHKKN